MPGARAWRASRGPATRRYEWARPGALIHRDTTRLARFERPGHRTRGRGERQRNRGAGWVVIHVAVDDHSRYAYVEQLGDERAPTRGLARAIAHFAELLKGKPESLGWPISDRS